VALLQEISNLNPDTASYITWKTLILLLCLANLLLVPLQLAFSLFDCESEGKWIILQKIAIVIFIIDILINFITDRVEGGLLIKDKK
jgi:hypothetical protein